MSARLMMSRVAIAAARVGSTAEQSALAVNRVALPESQLVGDLQRDLDTRLSLHELHRSACFLIAYLLQRTMPTTGQ